MITIRLLPRRKSAGRRFRLIPFSGRRRGVPLLEGQRRKGQAGRKAKRGKAATAIFAKKLKRRRKKIKRKRTKTKRRTRNRRRRPRRKRKRAEDRKTII